MEQAAAKARKAILEGSDEKVHVRYRNRYGRTRSYHAEFEGVMAFLQRRMEQTDSEQMKERYDGFMRDVPCPECQGTRLKPEILAVTLAAGEHGAKSIAEVCELSIADCSQFLNALTLGHRRQAIAGQVLRKSSPGWDSCSMSASSTFRSHARPARCRVVRPNAFGWLPRLVPGSSACCMCSTSLRSGYTNATTEGS